MFIANSNVNERRCTTVLDIPVLARLYRHMDIKITRARQGEGLDDFSIMGISNATCRCTLICSYSEKWRVVTQWKRRKRQYTGLSVRWL